MKEYFENATIHGVSKIYHSKRAHSRCFWAFILTVFIGSFSFLLYCRLEKFFSYKIQVTTTHEDNLGAMGFPSVTICNTNRASLVRFAKAMYQNGYVPDEESCNHARSMVDPLPEKDLHNLSNSDGLFVSGTCTFNSIEHACHEKNFRKEVTVVHGTCLTFNYNGDKLQTKPGSNYGLKFVVDIEEDDYFPCDYILNHKPVGIYISIHHPKSPPNLDQIVLAGPGVLTRIGLRKTYIKRLELPYKDDCRLTNDFSKDEYPIITYSAYNVEQCQSSCFIFRMNETCGGVDIETSLAIEGEYEEAFSLLEFDHPCLEDFRERFNNGTVKCKCRPLCEEYDYHYVINTAKWPAKVALDGWVRKVSEHKNKSVDRNYIMDNIVAVEIFYQEFRTVRTIHTPQYSLDTLAADMGGLSGLFIGASVFSLVELIVFLFLSFVDQFFKKRGETKKNTNTIFAEPY